MDTQTLMEAVLRFKKAEEEYLEARAVVATLLRDAAKTNQVTNLSRLTRINRTTIYWLINNKARSNINENRSA